MKFALFFILFCLLVAVQTGSNSNQLSASRTDTPSASPAVQFVENVGQFDEAARFQVVGLNDPLWLTDDALWITFLEQMSANDSNRALSQYPRGRRSSSSSSPAVNVRLQFIGANPNGRVEPFMPLDTRVSYYQGNDPANWHVKVPVWGGVRYVDLYPGIDLEISSQNGQLVQRLVGQKGLTLPGGAKGVAQEPIGLRLDGGTFESVEQGTLQIGTSLGLFAWALPSSSIAWQIEAEDASGRQLAVQVPANSPLERKVAGQEEELVGGSLRYGTFFGGSRWDEAFTLAKDSAGNIYFGGETQSIDFPTTLGYSRMAHNIEAFIAKINPNGSGGNYIVHLQAALEDYIKDIAINANGDIFAVGLTDSADFPTTSGAYDTTPNGAFDALVVKVNQSGELLFSTLLGGEQADDATAVAVDELDNIYLTGGTWSSNFPITNNAYDTSHNGLRDVYVAKFHSGRELEYATFLGGNDQEEGNGIALGGIDTVYLTGWTRSTTFPVTSGAYATSYNGYFEAFAVKMTLPEMTYATFLGGSDEDRGKDIAVDGNGVAVISGSTTSADFPKTTGAFDTTYSKSECSFVLCPDGFVLKLTSDGASLIYSSYLGGNNSDSANAVAIDEAGNAYLAGETSSTDFPVTGQALDSSLNGSSDSFVAVVDNLGTSLSYATYMGGSLEEDAKGIVSDESGLIYVAGRTTSNDFPVTADAYNANLTGEYDVFAVILESPSPTPFIPTDFLYLPLTTR